MKSSPFRVLLCIGGGIAAYKTPELIRQLTTAGYEVQVVATDAALTFVSELSLSVVSGRSVRHRLLDPDDEGKVGHIELADWPDAVVVAPATANLIGRAALGLADDLVTTVLLATRAPVLWAPAMNSNMWSHPAVVSNLETLRRRGHATVGPDRGFLACGWEGEGKMSDPSEIVGAVESVLRRRDRQPLSDRLLGKHVLVSAGPTRTYLDPVRFVSNASTGTMGFALAAAAQAFGARVTLVSGPVALATPVGVDRIDVETASQMREALRSTLARGDVDMLAMVAAVSDLKVGESASDKRGKHQLISDLASLDWQAEADIVAALAREFRPRTRFLAFAAETAMGDDAQVQGQLLERARAKLASKGTDAIFVNRVGASDTGMGVPTNAGSLVFAADDIEPSEQVVSSGVPVVKQTLARWMLDELAQRWFAGK